MKKLAIFALPLALLALATAPALARSTGIELDGRTYIFCEAAGGAPEGSARYEIDGKTFLVGADEVIVQESGKPDRHIPLEAEASADATATKGTARDAAERISEVRAIASDDGEEPAITYYVCDDTELAQGSASAEGATAVEELSDDAAERISEVCVTASDDGEESAITYYVCDDTELAQESSPAEGAIAAQDDLLTRDWSPEDAAAYAPFAPYGLRCDAETGKLYYLGAPVRVFEDAYGVDGGTAELDYFDEGGSVDVRSKRGADGALTGLEALSDAEFASRDLRKWTEPEPTRIMVATTGGAEPSPEERAAFFAPYAPFGLRYDAEEDRLYLNGRPVREFLDVRSSNGESPTGGKFRGSMTQLRFDGEVDVTVLRDYAQPDGNGEGRIVGVEVVEVG